MNFPRMPRRVIEFKADQFELRNLKNDKDIQRFLSERGKIVRRRVTSFTAKQQRVLSKALKTARFLALVPYLATDIT